ncbi:hypothetical protein EX30DRAFT_365076 [Ascodesmis nigricans]|uniref:Uncharacterized protein n=1 Tax=Ascodesmis nigricans TaxID=341454 RepID=A0A4S2MTK6_9PEZI|nr:hypothetical protein EX30DRAFT_365076 [Ascodesmis nigricans]
MSFTWPDPTDRLAVARLFLGSSSDIPDAALMDLTELPLNDVFNTYTLLHTQYNSEIDALNNELAEAHQNMFNLIEKNRKLIKEMDERLRNTDRWVLPTGNSRGGQSRAGMVVMRFETTKGDFESQKQRDGALDEGKRMGKSIQQQQKDEELVEGGCCHHEPESEQGTPTKQVDKRAPPFSATPSTVETSPAAEIKKEENLSEWEKELRRVEASLQSIKPPNFTAPAAPAMKPPPLKVGGVTLRRAKTAFCDCTSFCKAATGCQCSLWREPCGPRCHATAKKQGIPFGQVAGKLNCPRRPDGPNQTERLRKWENGGSF